MIPLRDANPSRSRPVVNTLLVLLNVAAFLYELSLGREATRFIQTFGVVPVDIMRSLAEGQWLGLGNLVSSTFLHGGWLHLIGNMLFLWIFGDNVEDQFGHIRYLLFYLTGGVTAGAAHVLLNSGSTMPTIGASGAVAAVLGAYTFLFPGARVMALVPLGFFLQIMELPAKLFLGVWFAFQFLAGAITSAWAGTQHVGGVAWWAHVGGFAYGFVIAVLFYRDRRRRLDPVYGEG